MFDELGFEIHMKQPYEQALEAVTAALKTQGFGILTRADVRATLKEKIGVDFRPYTILGACNPPLAHKALQHAPEVGLLLPCNVTVEENPTGGSIVRIANPAGMVRQLNRPGDIALEEVANEALQKLKSVVNILEEKNVNTVQAMKS